MADAGGDAQIVIRRLRQVLLAALLGFVISPFAQATYDLRLVVQADWLEDPATREAVSLVLHLLPEGGRVGLWRYGARAESLLPPGTVDADWRDRALASLQGEPGEGGAQLPAALDAALAAAPADPAWPRALLLMGDGRVEVADSPMVNAAGARDLDARFADSESVSWPIYTAVAGRGPGADLLASLARNSGGQALPAQASPADTWWRVLSAALPMTRLPLREGRVQVPGETRTLTWLIASARPALSIRPAQALVGDGAASGEGAANASTAGPGETRVRFAAHRLRRWESPSPGEWRVDGEDLERVAVFASLPLSPACRELPTRLLAGEALEGSFGLLQEGVAGGLPEEGRWRVRLEGPADYVAVASPEPLSGRLPLLFSPLQQPGWYRLQITLERGPERLSWVYRLQVEPAATGSSISTRPPDLPQANLRTATLSLLVFLLGAGILISWILRRRRRHKLRLWEQRRGRST